MRATKKRRGVLIAVTTAAVGSVLAAGVALSADANAATVAAQSGPNDPEIDQAETTSVVPSYAKSGDLLVVRDDAVRDANGQPRTTLYHVVDKVDLGKSLLHVIEGTVGGAATGAGVAKISSGDGGATLLSIPVQLLGGITGGIVGGGGVVINELGEIIFNPSKGVVLVKDGENLHYPNFDAAQHGEYAVPGHYNSSTGIVEPIDTDFQP